MERITPAAAQTTSPLQARTAWTGVVRLLGDAETIELRGLELGRCTLVAEGDRLLPKSRSISLELELQGERVQFVANIEASVVTDGRALMMFRFGSTSPRGNDLLRAFSRNDDERRSQPPTPKPKRLHRGAAALDPGTVLMRAPDGHARKRLWPGPRRVLH